jgi:hypothetical protein
MTDTTGNTYELWNREADYFSTTDYKNELCKLAKRITNHDGKCTESCPFASCIMDLPSGTRNILINTKRVLAVLDLLSRGKSKPEVSRQTNTKYKNVEYYANNMDYLYEILQGYGILQDMGL